MNSELVFSKTAAGEEALVLQGKHNELPRTMRTVLILVDGRSTVAALGAKMSSLDLVVTALTDLEKRGYVAQIERGFESKGGTTAHAGESFEAGKSFITGEASTVMLVPVLLDEADKLEKAEKLLVETIELFGTGSVTGQESKLDAGENRIASNTMASTMNDDAGDELDGADGLESVPVLMEVVDPSLVAETGALDGRTGSEATEVVEPNAEEAGSNGVSSSAERGEAGRIHEGAKNVVSVATGTFVSILRRWQAWRHRRQAVRNKVPIMLSRHRSRFPGEAFRQAHRFSGPRNPSARLRRGSSGMKKVLITLILLAALGAAVLTAFPPLSVYVAEIESSMSISLGRPVKIGRLSASVYPHLGILLNNVVIDGEQGSADGAANIHIDKLWLEPDVRTLFSPRKDFRHVFVNGMRLVPETLTALPTMLQQTNGEASKFRINRLRFEQVMLDIPKLTLGDLQGQAELSDVAGLSALQLHTDDRKLRLTLKPDGQRIEFEADGAAMRIPALAPVDFNSISVKGIWENGAMDVSAFDFRLFDGAIKGQAKVQLAQGRDKDTEDIAVKGDLVFDHVDSSKLSAALGAGNLLAGELAGKASFSGAAMEWAGILPALTAEGSFMIERGGLNGVDLVEAARRTSDAPVLGGAMSFEQFSGKMRLTSARSRFYGLVMSSGRMHSVGSAEVAANQSLSGRMDLQIRGSVNQMRVPIALDGTLQSPSVRAVRPQRTVPTVSSTPGANGNPPVARSEAPKTERSGDDLSASRESDNILLPSVPSARF